tara:strand:+ start:354 stop:863 length:510 start_codon:yes stop_codon:yes gene_type:complete
MKILYPIGVILFLAFSRLIPHPPNFTPVISIALLSGYFFSNIYLSVTVLLISIFISDFFLGFYENMIYVYFTFILINLIFFKISYKINFKNLYLFSCFATLIFYLVSNFSVWATGTLYEKNLAGLIDCYVLAIPFLKNTLISTLFYSYLGLFIFKPKYKFKSLTSKFKI